MPDTQSNSIETSTITLSVADETTMRAYLARPTGTRPLTWPACLSGGVRGQCPHA